MVAGHLQVKKNYYYMVLNLKGVDGQRKIKWLPTGIPVGGKKNEKRANEMLMEARCNYNSGAVVIKQEKPTEGQTVEESMLFSDFMKKWLNIIKASVEETTYAGYKIVVESRIAPYFEQLGVTLGTLTSLDIECFYEYCYNTLKLKGTTVQHYHANIHKALKYAVRHDLISSNPMDKVDRPKVNKYVASFYTAAELEKLFQAAKGDPLEFPILMSAFYGLRREEILGLRWQDVDFEENVFTITHTVTQTREDGKTRIIRKDRTKNRASCRSMPLVPEYRELLLRMKKRQENCRLLCGNCYEESDYIWVNDLGVPYKPEYVSTHFKLLLQKNGLRHIRFHDLRHTCASLLLKNGASMKDIQEWLGHSNYATTANIYTHLESTSKIGSATVMSATVRIDPSIQSEV